MFDLDGEPCYLWVANDITEQKHAEEGLRALSARLHSAREEEGTRIAREIHDELGGILTGLKWDLEKIDTILNNPSDGSQLFEVHNLSGKEVADRLLELRPSIRVRYMSGYTDEAIVQHGVLDANVEFIQKPFTWFGLTRKVRDVLNCEA